MRQYEQEFHTKWTTLIEAFHWAYGHAIKGEPTLEPTALRYTIESTGTYHMPVLLAWRGRPSIVNPLLAGPTRRKTDVLDARMLGHHSLVGMWPASFIPGQPSEILRVLMGMRFEASRNSTRALNRIGNHVLRFGHTFGRDHSMADPYAKGVVEDLCRGIVPEGDSICPDGLPEPVRCFFLRSYRIYEEYKALRDEYTKLSLAYVKGRSWPIDPAVSDGGKVEVDGATLLKNLLSVPGVGEISALTWLAVVCDPRRFQNANQVAAFCGADPSLKVSAGKVTSHTKRKGNARLHHVLKNVAAQLVRRHSEPLGQWGFAIAKRTAKGGWAKAINAVSRRLSILLWQVHRRGVEFSYEQYTFYLVPEVVDVPIEEMGLGKRYTDVLIAAGCSRSSDIARAFITTLPHQKGIGAGCLAKVKAWIEENKLVKPLPTATSPLPSDCSSGAKSSAAAANSKSAKKPVNNTKSSTTASPSATASSPSTTTSRTATTTRCTRRSKSR